MMAKRCLWCIHDVPRRDNEAKHVRVCANKASEEFQQEIDVLDDGCMEFEEENIWRKREIG